VGNSRLQEGSEDCRDKKLQNFEYDFYFMFICLFNFYISFSQPHLAFTVRHPEAREENPQNLEFCAPPPLPQNVSLQMNYFN